MDEHLYIVAYDISDQKRWRRVFRMMHGYGEWLQLSVFQCRMSRRRHAEMVATLDQLIHHSEDRIVVMDVGPADRVTPKVVSMGQEYEPVTREPVIV
jgi:CRISPR-associated protein Cas2